MKILGQRCSQPTIIQTIRIYSYFEKGCRKNVRATIPKGIMGYDQYTVSDNVAAEPTFSASL